MITTADNILFRCSALGKLMTEPRTKSETLSETTKKYLVEVYIQHHYQREKYIENKYITKGLQVEEDSITLYSQYKSRFFKKNESRFNNEYIAGTPDIILDNEIIDVKSSYDIFTFYNSKMDGINKSYYWQLQGYMALTGAHKAKLVYCLVDTPNAIFMRELNSLKWQMGVTDDTDKLFQEAANKLEETMRYGDIPIEERVHEIDIIRNNTDIDKLYERIKECRKWINENLLTTRVKQAGQLLNI